jgi:hypothetical protein
MTELLVDMVSVGIGGLQLVLDLSSLFFLTFSIFLFKKILMMGHREYVFTVRQEPKQARMCGVDDKGLILPVSRERSDVPKTIFGQRIEDLLAHHLLYN